jgi:PAS domain S-box-containing protein
VNALRPGTSQFVRLHSGSLEGGAIPDNDIYSILEDHEGTVWIGTGKKGLFRYNRVNNHFESFPPFAASGNDLLNTPLMALWADPDRTLWITSLGKGLFRLDTKSGALTHLAANPLDPSAPASNSILCLTRTRDGVLWLGTFADGLEAYSSGRFTRYRHDPGNPNSLRNDRVLSLYEDPEGTLWIGTWGGGLNRLSTDRKTFTSFTERDGLPNNTIYGILSDPAGNLWLSTNRGICRFSPNTQTFRVYTTRDGLQDNEFNEGAYCRGNSGAMYFGGGNGITVFHPSEIQDNPHAPPVVITALRRFGLLDPEKKEYPPDGEIRLRYYENFFSLEFAALDFLVPEKNQYRYQLEGFDSQWSPPDSRHVAVYTKVPPGRYTFRVQASNGDGLWNKTGAALSIVIIPPIWANWWAYTFYASATGFLIFLFYRRRTQAHAKELAAKEEELRRERDFAETLRLQSAALQSAANSIVITNRGGEILWVNPAFTSMTGYLAEEVRGQNLMMHNAGMQPSDFFAELCDTVLAGKTWHQELVNRKKNSETYIEEMTITPVFDSQQVITHFIAIKQDVTGRKKLEQQLLHAQKLESIGTLAGGIAHDFNNLLGIIIGYTDLLSAMNHEDADLTRSVNAIETAAQRGAALVRQILTFARKSEGSFLPTDLNEIIRDLVGMLLETFPKVIAIQVSLLDSLPPINADQGQIHQALLNLSLNSRDAMPDGGTLEFTTSEIEGRLLQERHPAALAHQYVWIKVRDTGLGMNEAELPRIFEPFFTTKEPGRGSGLGLAVVYGIVQLHHGFIEVDSRPGQGTSFNLFLPETAGMRAVPTARTVGERKIICGQETILLVEDEPLLLQLLDSALRQNGYRVLKARDGMEALSLFSLRKHEIDLVLSDYGLPKLTGDQVFKELWKIKPKVPVVLASGNLSPDIRTNLLEAGVCAIVQKPYSIKEILAIIHEITKP